MKYYEHVFNEALFIISVDDINDFNLIRDVRHELNNLNISSITFVVEQNTEYREAYGFYKYVALRANDLTGITFFGHNKGITNIYCEDYNKESIFRWVYGLYYFNLEKICVEECIEKLISNQGIFYGAMASYRPEKSYADAIYSGTFFWGNYNTLYNNEHELEIPKLTNRFYAEDFQRNIFKGNDFLCSNLCFSFKDFYLFTGTYNFAKDYVYPYYGLYSQVDGLNLFIDKYEQEYLTMKQKVFNE